MYNILQHWVALHAKKIVVLFMLSMEKCES